MSVDLVDDYEDCDVPNAKWSLQKLAGVIEEEKDALRYFGRKTAIHTWRLGRALSIAKGKCKSGQWNVFLKNACVSIATDNRARRLFEHFEEHELAGLTITEAYREAGISKREESDEIDDSEESAVVQIDPSDDEDEAEEEEEEEAPTHLQTAQRKNKPGSATETEKPTKEDSADFGRRLAQLEAATALLAKNFTAAASAEEHECWLALIDSIRAHLDSIEKGTSHE